ncbi:hypothetical protein [Paraferrimonas sedimenticola]|uniref:Alginate export domain-containing protein n=1 Tax=Paraferrimonas sedimenticola TaxID=375674 RepID=A0AA37RVB7_9GAMM|nr:hypothetical protein [Paraferrimonas sedimenticola]GLP95970.1 hypothetical protein GCM10007895_12760 [Paraferrimonas sedimenticola]
MPNRLGLWLVCLLWLAPGLALANIPGLKPQKKYDLNGYVKYMGSGANPENGSHPIDHLVHNRFNFEYRFNDNLRFNAGMRNRLLWGSSTGIPGYGELIKLDPGYLDLSYNWLDNGDAVGNTQFDRLYFNWEKSDWQLRGGRFRINWGMTQLWNPNDIFNSYSIYDFDYEERAGTDAVMVSRKLGYASGYDLVVNPAKDSELNSYAGRYLWNTRGWDIQVIGGKSGLDHVIGGGFAGDIKGAGLRGEFTYFDPTRDSWRGETLEATTVASVETDYSFGGRRNWVGRLAVLHISNPMDPGSALAFLNLPLTARTLSFTQWTGYTDIGFDINPLSRLTFSCSSYDDGSYFVGANASYSLTQDIQLLGVLQRFDGSPNSLFGKSANTLVFAQLKWSF